MLHYFIKRLFPTQNPTAEGTDGAAARAAADRSGTQSETAAAAPQLGDDRIGPDGEVLADRAGDEPDDDGGAADPALRLQGRDRHERARQAQEAAQAPGRTDNEHAS